MGTTLDSPLHCVNSTRILARTSLHLYQLLLAHQQPVTNPLSYMTIFLALLWNSTTVSLDELVTGVFSSMAQGRKFLSGLSVENFVISQGDFIHDQLIGLDETCKQNDNLFCELPVLAALRDKKRKSKDSLPGKATAACRVPKQILRICDKEKKNETKGRVISATTTKLVNRIWGDFKVNEDEEIRIEDEEVENTEENMEEDSEVEEEKTLLLEKIKKPYSVVKRTKFCSTNKEITWDGQPGDKTCARETFYKRAIVRGDAIAVGSSVLVEMDDSDDVSPTDCRKMVHGRLMLRGFQTFLGTSANERGISHQ